MLNWIVSPSCRLVSACRNDVSTSGSGLTLLVVLTVMTAAWVTAQNRASVAVKKSNVSFCIRQSCLRWRFIPCLGRSDSFELGSAGGPARRGRRHVDHISPRDPAPFGSFGRSQSPTDEGFGRQRLRRTRSTESLQPRRAFF